MYCLDNGIPAPLDQPLNLDEGDYLEVFINHHGRVDTTPLQTEVTEDEGTEAVIQANDHPLLPQTRSSLVSGLHDLYSHGAIQALETLYLRQWLRWPYCGAGHCELPGLTASVNYRHPVMDPRSFLPLRMMMKTCLPALSRLRSRFPYLMRCPAHPSMSLTSGARFCLILWMTASSEKIIPLWARLNTCFRRSHSDFHSTKILRKNCLTLGQRVYFELTSMPEYTLFHEFEQAWIDGVASRGPRWKGWIKEQNCIPRCNARTGSLFLHGTQNFLMS